MDELPVKGLDVPAAHGTQAALDVLPALGLYVPAAQSEHDGVPPVLKVPAAHERHVAIEEAPSSADHLPAGQGVRLSTGVRKGQYEPAGHSTGAPEEQ